VREGDEAALARRQVQAVAATAVAVLAAVGGLACLASSAGESFSDAGAVLDAVLDHLRGGPLRGTYTFVVERPGRAAE